MLVVQILMSIQLATLSLRNHAVISDAKQGIVDKLQYAFTGPWQVTAILRGASYELEHCDTKQKEKKHASDLSPYPVELIPFQPVNGADTRCF